MCWCGEVAPYQWMGENHHREDGTLQSERWPSYVDEVIRRERLAESIAAAKAAKEAEAARERRAGIT